MADKITDLFDAEIRAVLQASVTNRQDQLLQDQIEARRAIDPSYGADFTPGITEQDQVFHETRARLADRQSLSEGRNVGEHLQDMGAGLLGTLDTIGNTAILGVSAAGDALGNLTGTNLGWDATKTALQQMNDGREFTTSLQSEKSDAFDRLAQYRQNQAIEQANLASRMLTGEDASWVERQAAAFGAAGSSYLDDPGQIITDGIAQLPYLMTGGLAKGITQGTSLANPLIAQLSKKMSVESAEKLVQMGLVGGMQGTIEGADAAASVYERVMSSTDTNFADEAAREMAALEAAGKAFGIAGATSAITGTLASKWDLSPFGAAGSSALARTGDNLIKALQEGVQESIESGTSQFAGNLAGNQVLEGKDLVALDQGVGGAAGTGFVVGAGSTTVTNPRSVVDAAIAPLSLAGKGLSYMGDKAATAERREDMLAAATQADTITETLQAAPAVAAAIEENIQTVDTPPEDVVLPPEVNTNSQIGLFATGMEYLRGKDMNSKDAVEAFHVLGSVLAAANNIRSMRDSAKRVVADTTHTPEDRDAAQKLLVQFNKLMSGDQLDKWVEQLPMEDIESELEDLKQNPENFGAVIAHLATMNPLKMTEKVIETALEAKSLPKAQRESLELAKELKVAEAELKGYGKPDSDGVTRSMMQTGFPGSKENDSVAGYISKITQALAENDMVSAQVAFHRLVKFRDFEQGRAAAFEAAAQQMAKDPNSAQIDLPGYYQLDDMGKLDKTKLQFVNKKSLGLVKVVRNDADAIAKMTAAIQKRTGLEVAEATPETAPVVEAKPEAPKAPVETKQAETKPEIALSAAPATVEEENELADLSDDAINQEIDSLAASIRRRRSNDTGKAVEQDTRYSNLVREVARRMQSAPKKPVGLKRVDGKYVPVVDKPVENVAPAQAEPVAAPVDIVIEDDVVAQPLEATPVEAQETVVDESRNHLGNLQPSYPVAEGATVAERNDAINHLAQSFTTSDKPGLISKLPKTLQQFFDQLGVSGEDAEVAGKVAGLKSTNKARLQEKIQEVFKSKLGVLRTSPYWKSANAHSLYATIWNDKKIAYDPIIADVMAWTGVQHLLDLAYPMSWSEDMKRKMLMTYGPGILPMLAEGWVPLQDQVQQVAKKLQVNLELKADKNVPQKFTEGTMLALAMDTLSVMFQEEGFDGPLRVTQVIAANGAPVNWVNVAVANRDLLFDSARVMENFFPERASTNAAIVGGDAPTSVNAFYRGSQQKIGKEQRKALLRRSQTAHKLSPLLLTLSNALPKEARLRLLGWKAVSNKPFTLAEIEQNGANLTLESDLRVIDNHLKKVEAYASEQDMELTAVPSRFEYEQVVNGRAMTKGISPQSSKWYREMFSTVQRVIDPNNPNIGFRMAVAQGLGSKMDKRQVSESLKWMEATLAKPEVQRALEAAHRFAHGDVSMLEEDLTAFEQSGIEITPHAISAMVHWAEHQAASKAGTTFTSSLSYEIDGLTDGPINLMMLMGLHGSAAAMESWLALGGLFFGEEKIAVQDRIEQIKDLFGARDMYEIIANKATAFNADRAKKIVASVAGHQKQDADGLIRAIDHLMLITKMAERDDKGNFKHSRSFTKKPTQASGYLQGEVSIVNDLANGMLGALSERMAAGLLDDRDRSALNVVLGRRIGYSDKDKRFYVTDLKEGYSAVGWEGDPLTLKEFRALTSTLSMYGGYGLVNGTFDTIGRQRANLLSATNLINAQIEYAQDVLREKYAEKQAAEVAVGNLREKDALSRKDEEALIKEVWGSLIPHPMLRNTGGLPTASTSRSGVSKNDVMPVQGALFGNRNLLKGSTDQNLWLSEAAFEDPGVSFGALSIMAAGDGAMMTGFQANNDIDSLDMYDGIYIDPEDIDQVGDLINKEVKANWKHDFIGAILGSLKLTPEFQAWAEARSAKDKLLAQDGVTLWEELESAKAGLVTQQAQQKLIGADIESRDRSYSHMAGHNNPHWEAGTALNSATLGTSVSDPLLDMALDSLGEAVGGVRQLSKADVISLFNNHTFENPVLSGLWKVLAPLIDDNLRLYVSSDRQAMGDFYQQNERRSMSLDADGTAVGDRVYVRAITAEVLMHELLHYTTKSLVATFYRQPSLLTGTQREAMRNLETLMMDFLSLSTDEMSESGAMWVRHAQRVVYGYNQQGNDFAAMEEFLAYGLTNYHMQRTLGNTATRVPLLESIFQAVKKLFGFPAGTKSDSMLASMFSNFSALTEQAINQTLPIAPEEALNAINPKLAVSFGPVIERIINNEALQSVLNETQGQAGSATARYAARGVARERLEKINQESRTRMQELADTNLFPAMTEEQQAAGEYIQALFAAGLQFKAADNALLARVVDAVREEGPKAWGTDPDLAQARFNFFFENTASKHDRAADILSMALVNEEFAEYMDKVILPHQEIDKGSLNNWLDSSAQAVYEKMDTGLALGKDASLSAALEVAALRIHKSMLASAKRREAKPGAYRRLTEKLSEGVHLIGEKAGKLADARLKLKSNKDWIGSGLMIVAGMSNDRYADQLANMVLSLSNQMEKFIPGREVVQEMTGTTSDNFKLIQLKGIAARMVSAIRQTFREQVPVTVKSWFKDLSPEMDSLLHTVIGKMALYSLSQDLKDRLGEVLTDPKDTIHMQEVTLLSSGDRTQRLLMIKAAKQLGDRMANQGNAAVYLNTRAIAGLAVHGGAGVLSAVEMEALENLSTLQALSHLTTSQRRATLSLFRENTEGFWKTTALIHAYQKFDTERAGENTATMNFQKGWIPVEADGRKKVKLFQASEVRKAERMGWVKVGEFADDDGLVYMATTIGKTPTLSGGAIHAVDMHMNGIHFHSGMPTDPSIQTTITNPRQMKEIQSRILNGEVMPYVALYDAAGDVQGFQRSLDPAVVERHTKTVGRISDAAGIWLGRLHEERVAHGQNQAAADLLRKTWDQGQADKRDNEFVDIRQTIDLKNPNAKQDKVLVNVWETLPYHTKVQLEKAFANGSKNPPIWIRRDQLNDAIGYHKASVSNFFTGDNRYEQHTNANVAALSRQVLGKNAYKYLKTAEEGWQALIGSAKDTIIVKSLVVALNNLASNQIQLFMITGNPVWNLRVQSQKHKELVSYLGYQQRHARLTAEELATTDPKAKARYAAEKQFLKNEMRKLSIYPLIEAGEMPTIAEGLSETEEFSLVGDFTAWAEKQMGKMPSGVSTVLNNLAVSKETSLYKGLDRMVQYGDFVAKATMYEWLTTQDKSAKKEAFDLMAKDSSKKLTMTEALHEVALREINDEFVNYARLPGRWRTYGEDMGLLWFYNYKLRILKMGIRRVRKNPAAFLIGAQVGGMLGVATLLDTLPGNANFAYSTGIDPLFTAHQTIFWNQAF